MKKYDLHLINHAAKNAQVATTLLQQICYNKPISEYVHMACNSLLTTSLGKLCRLVINTCYPQACWKLFQQLVTSLQMTKCNKPDFTRPTATWWNWQVSLLQLLDKLQQAGKINNCGVFCWVRKTCRSTAETLIFVIMKKTSCIHEKSSTMTS